MKYALSISVALLLAVCQWQPASAQDRGGRDRQKAAQDLVSRAVKAQGGAEALRALKGLSIRAESKFWEPEQSKAAGGEAIHVQDTKSMITWDLARGTARTDWDRDHKYPAPAIQIKYTEIVLPTLGVITNQQGSQAMASVRLAAAARELGRVSPTLLLKAMDNPNDVRSTGNQRIGRVAHRAVTYTDGPTQFTILFDNKTNLPAVIRTKDDDNIHGDSAFDAVLGDWKSVGGVMIAHAMTYRLNGVDIAKVTYTNVTANPTIATDAFAVPDTVRTAARAPATKDVPFQWIIRRLNMSRYMDTEVPFLAAGASIKLVELAPNVQHAQGASANNLIVAMKDHLVVFDAPYGDALSHMVIDLAKAKYPGKPIKHLVLTHHHMDHAGGLRAYVAEGANIIVAAPTKARFEQTLRRPRTVANDAQQKARKPLRITEVKEQLTLKDETGEIRLYNIKNPHSEGYVLGHVVKENIVFVTDLISPRGPVARNENTLAVGAALKKYGITGSVIAGGHGTTAKQADIATALGTEVSSR